MRYWIVWRKNSMYAIETVNLVKNYSAFTLNNINLKLPKGTIMGLIGENGAGKSTLIQLILDMIEKDDGCVKLLGKEKYDMSELNEDIGIVIDGLEMPDTFKVSEVKNIMKHAYKHWDNELFEHYLNCFKIKNDTLRNLSYGTRKKLSIAIALSHHPKLLILDEATSGLDPIARDEVLDILNEFTRDEDHSILISSHIVEDLEKICDYISFLHQGELLLCEEKDMLLEKYACIHVTKEKLTELDSSSIVGVKENPYGVEAVVIKKDMPQDLEFTPIDIETLFIFMVKGEK